MATPRSPTHARRPRAGAATRAISTPRCWAGPPTAPGWRSCAARTASSRQRAPSWSSWAWSLGRSARSASARPAERGTSLAAVEDMFLTAAEALGQAAERRAHGHDDRAAERDGRERAHEAGAEEARADHGQHDELDRHRDDPDEDRHVVGVDQEGQRVEHAPEERPAAGDRPSLPGVAAAGVLAGVRERF